MHRTQQSYVKADVCLAFVHDYAGDCGGNKGGSMAESVESVAGRRDNNNDGGVVVVLADVRVWVWCGGRRRFIGILMDVQPSPQKEGDSF
jgi:hypothetical protein